jgi:GT2 family glycosyltransferase
MKSDATVAIVIPVFRGAADVERCLASLRRAGEPQAAVIVVDDCSGDGTAEMVERDFPEVRLVRRSSNGGFARAANTGLAHVPAGCEFVAVLNSDTAVAPGWLAPAVAALRRDGALGSVAPRVVRRDDPSVIDSAGQAYTISGWAYRRGHGLRFGPPFDEPRPVLGPTGSAAVFRRRALADQPCLYRDDLDCYYEDTELAFRLQLAGWRCLYVPGSIVRHGVSRAYGRRPAHKAFHVSRNLELMFWEYMPARLLGRAVADHLLLTVLHGAQQVWQGHGLAYFQGKLAFLSRAVETRARRRRRRADADLSTWIDRRWLGHVMRHRAGPGASMTP